VVNRGGGAQPRMEGPHEIGTWGEGCLGVKRGGKGGVPQRQNHGGNPPSIGGIEKIKWGPGGGRVFLNGSGGCCFVVLKPSCKKGGGFWKAKGKKNLPIVKRGRKKKKKLVLKGPPLHPRGTAHKKKGTGGKKAGGGGEPGGEVEPSKNSYGN